MPKSSRLFLFPDINVWIALTYERHVHHTVASGWFEALAGSARLFFCRFTQLGLLRLLTSETVMSQEVMSQEQAWRAYDRWLEDDRVELLEEALELERFFRGLASSRQAAPKDWADSYLTAFAMASRLTIVTFDQGFQAKARDMVLLRT